MNNQPIGILDSGVGGLSVWQEIVTLLPNESTVYIADSKNVPYGKRDEEEIFELSKRLVQFLLDKKSKLIVVACNTITVSSLDRLRLEFPKVSIVGIVPVVKTASERTKNKRIGILSTKATAKSEYQQNLIDKFAKNIEVLTIGTDELVPFVERGEKEGAQLRSVLKRVLAPAHEQGVDVIALGCSHFPFLRDSMQEILGLDVLLLDSSGAVSRQVGRVIEERSIDNRGSTPNHSLYTTGEKEVFERTIEKLIFDTMLTKVGKIEKAYV